MTLLLARQLGRVLLVLAGLAALTAATLFIVAGYVLTWPYRRRGRRRSQLAAVMELGVAAAAVAAVFRDDVTPAVDVVD